MFDDLVNEPKFPDDWLCLDHGDLIEIGIDGDCCRIE